MIKELQQYQRNWLQHAERTAPERLQLHAHLYNPIAKRQRTTKMRLKERSV
jgi:hypothetical protein